MQKTESGRICPVEISGGLDNFFRRWIQNPTRILKPYLNPGYKVLDFGCGPGFFTIDIAQLVGETGTVYAADLQEGMLEKVRKKVNKTQMHNRIKIHKCEESGISLNDTVDFILAFYMIHEVVNQGKIFQEFKQLLNPQGKVLIIEPDFHVSKNDFNNMISRLEKTNFKIIERPKISFSRSILLQITL
jgi:ubiquinone/menaquinone biosynthesis C-methylase UbiE